MSEFFNCQFLYGSEIATAKLTIKNYDNYDKDLDTIFKMLFVAY